ncbi:bifunctional YncE family protein/alkaline phosphatase family protein [Verrucomicrobiota bacterium sgz303538]
MRRSLFLLFALGIATVDAQTSKPSPNVPGQRPDGAVLLPNQWTLRPVGSQEVVGDFPVNISIHPSGKWAAVLHCGNGQHEIIVLAIARNAVVSRVSVNEAFYGITFSKDGDQVLCSGAGDETINSFRFDKGFLSEPRSIVLRETNRRGIPSGVALSADGKTLYVTNLWGHSITRVRLDDATARPEDLSLGDAPANAPAPQQQPTTDDPSITKRAAQALEAATADAPFPYACVLDEARERLYVSLWGQSSVVVINTKDFTVQNRWAVEEHPNEMLLSKDGRHLFVANANRNSVSVLDVESGKVVETLIAELQPNSPPGNTPNSLALSPDGEHLFVANANINTVAVFEVEDIGKSRSLGFIPVGWYPTSVRVTPDGKYLLVANGKGLISKPNRNGPKPGIQELPTTREYIASLFQGTVSRIELPKGEKFQERLKTWTAQAFQCQPEQPRQLTAESFSGNPIPRAVGEKSPIKYVLYIVKENRTFDQVLGDIGKGNADPSLCLFGENVTPNHHALAREFVLLDNFYVESEVSADGHEWSLGAYATDFVEKTWPMTYGHNKRNKYPYPAEGGFKIAQPAGGYLWDRAKEAGVSYRSYGEFVKNGAKPGDPMVAKVKTLIGHIDPEFRSFDVDYPDVKRADRFISELQRFENEGEMPRLQIVRLPNDHTAGASPGKPTPVAYLADNDRALGMLVEAVSKSKFWPQTAIFVVEDDAQNGSDHVDAHRTIAYAISPYINRGMVDSTLYSTSSMLRTMELILGMKPMSQFDAVAMPMFACFQEKPDLTPYVAKPVTADGNQLNAADAWGAKESLAMDLTEEDAADDLKLNEIIWKSVRGANSAMPAPRRAAFVFTKAEDDDDDEK